MRGKAPCRAVLPHAIGITPAYAGKRTEITEVEDENGDHPRLCGEKLPQCLYLFHHVGSPPPMRGKAKDCRPPAEIIRITPAYAGKRPVIIAERISFWDHPRLCGEKTLHDLTRVRALGSPPPMRGKGITEGEHKKQCRITPAYAGKSRNAGVVVAFVGDHPRLCGEKFKNYVDLFHDKGSPPPMRGKAHTRGVALRLTGITPAYAGKSYGYYTIEVSF